MVVVQIHAVGVTLVTESASNTAHSFWQFPVSGGLATLRVRIRGKKGGKEMGFKSKIDPAVIAKSLPRNASEYSEFLGTPAERMAASITFKAAVTTTKMHSK